MHRCSAGRDCLATSGSTDGSLYRKVVIERSSQLPHEGGAGRTDRPDHKRMLDFHGLMPLVKWSVAAAADSALHFANPAQSDRDRQAAALKQKRELWPEQKCGRNRQARRRSRIRVSKRADSRQGRRAVLSAAELTWSGSELGTGFSSGARWVVFLAEDERVSKRQGTTSLRVSTNRSVRSALTSAGMSTRSFSLCRGKSTILMPARRAARIFSRTPPTGRTRPVRVTSPVIARLGSIGVFAEQADQSGGDGHAGRGAVLGDCARGDVDVQVGLAEPRGVEIE